jgi:hypothetical protein
VRTVCVIPAPLARRARSSSSGEISTVILRAFCVTSPMLQHPALVPVWQGLVSLPREFPKRLGNRIIAAAVSLFVLYDSSTVLA